jgi:hypothetical protein
MGRSIKLTSVAFAIAILLVIGHVIAQYGTQAGVGGNFSYLDMASAGTCTAGNSNSVRICGSGNSFMVSASAATPVAIPNLTSANIGDAALTPNTAAGISAQRVCHFSYSFAVDGGAVGAITPASNCTLPINSVITNISLNSTTALLAAGGAATISVGTTAGSSATSMLAATNKTSFSTNAFVQGIPVPQTASTWVKMTAAGSMNITVATNALTAGVLEGFVFYVVSPT